MISLGGSRDSQTICAVSTPPGYGGISVIRISGPKASEVTSRCLRQFTHKTQDSHRAYYGQFRNPATGEEVDQVVALYFAAGKSYTGEETIELSCHGNPIVCERILKVLIEQGLKPAQPGEFTYRAFMNNRLDLVQAESVLSLIESRSQRSAEVAIRQLEGDLSREISEIENELTWCLAHIEAGIDFSTEGLEVTTEHELVGKLSACVLRLERLLSTYQKGKTIKDGLQVVLVGRPNVGKSSLLNLLLGYERAIVTAQAGTTRDVVDADIIHEGLRIVIQDTAGLRDECDTDDQIEIIGMKKSKDAAQKADVVLFCFDASEGWSSEDEKWLKNLNPREFIFLANKADLVANSMERENLVKNLQLRAEGARSEVLFVSALDRKDRDVILALLKKVGSVDLQGEQVLLSHVRHFENVLKATNYTQQAIAALQGNIGSEFVSVELKEALIALQETLGKRFDDQIMDRVFKEFCIGK